MIAVSTSDTGMEYSTPESPKNRGSSRAKPTPNTISRTMESSVDAAVEAEIRSRGLDDFCMREIPQRKQCRCNLPDDGGDGCARHTEAAAEDKDGVEDDVDDRADQGGDHGKARTAVGADDGVHRLSEHFSFDNLRKIKNRRKSNTVGLTPYGYALRLL